MTCGDEKKKKARERDLIWHTHFEKFSWSKPFTQKISWVTDDDGYIITICVVSKLFISTSLESNTCNGSIAHSIVLGGCRGGP